MRSHGSAFLYAVPSQSSAGYSLDKKLYTGRRPFEQHANDVQVMLDVLSGQRPGRPHNSQCFVELGDAVWGVVTLAWNQDPLARPNMDVVHALLLGMVMPNEISSFDTDPSARQAPRDSTDGVVPMDDDARPSTSERALAPAAPGVVSRLSGEENTHAPAATGAATTTATIDPADDASDWNSDSTLSIHRPAAGTRAVVEGWAPGDPDAEEGEETHVEEVQVHVENADADDDDHDDAAAASAPAPVPRPAAPGAATPNIARPGAARAEAAPAEAPGARTSIRAPKSWFRVLLSRLGHHG
jgi:hypothetical protein